MSPSLPFPRLAGAALAALLLLLPVSSAAGSAAVRPGDAFTLEFSFPLSNLCTYQVQAIDVVPPNAIVSAAPTEVTGQGGLDSFAVGFTAASPGTGTAQVTLFVQEPGCEALAVVSAFYEIVEASTPDPNDPGPADPNQPSTGPPSLSSRAAARELHRSARGELREARQEFKRALDRFCDDLDAIESGLRGSSSADAADVVDDVLGAFNDLFGELGDAAREAASDITVSALFLFLQTNGIPFSGALAGDCDTLDEARARLVRDMDRTTSRAIRKFKAFSRRVAKAGQGALTARVSAPAPPPIAPNPAAPGPAPFPIRKDLEVGATLAVDVPGPDARQICVSGTADPGNGDPVHVSVVVPGSDPESVVAEGDAFIDFSNCRWRLCLSATGAGLAPGNYTVRATQPVGLRAETTIGVPSADAGL